jgi:hypothetical protein
MDLPIIFLDFDGVVETIYWDRDAHGVYHINAFKSGHKDLNNKQAIGWLNELYRQCPYDIVVSSTWRMGMTVEELQDLLLRSGFAPEINVIGKTPVLYSERGHEIQRWMDDNNYTGNFVIIDDDSDMCHLQSHLVQCDTYVGFTFHDFRKSIQILQK